MKTTAKYGRRESENFGQNVAPDDDIQGGRRLIHDHQLWFEGKSHRDHDTLAHPTGQLEA